MGAWASTHLQIACIKGEGEEEVEVAVELAIAFAWYPVRPRAIDSAFLVEFQVGQPGRKAQPLKRLFLYHQTERIYRSNTTDLYVSSRQKPI